MGPSHTKRDRAIRATFSTGVAEIMNESNKLFCSVTLPKGWALATLDEITEPSVRQAVPDANRLVTYVDIGSVDRSSKLITTAQQVEGKTAPTRARQWISE